MQTAFKTDLDIRYRDTDSMGHVSSPVYYEYMQTAYLEYMHEILEIPKSEKLPHIMVKTSCEYVAQAKYGDKVVVLSRVSRFGGKSFEMEHVMHVGDAQGTCIAKGNSVHVMYDYDKQATQPVPEAFRDTVLAFQGGV